MMVEGSLPSRFNTAVHGLARQTEMNGMQIGKEEIKVSVLTGDMVAYVEILREFTRKLLELICK